MLQLFHSLHTYACYYALLCFLFQQQPLAASITIIIDGATTNEWATRDEYQRLVDSSQGPTGLGGPSEALAGQQLASFGRLAGADGSPASAPSDQHRHRSHAVAPSSPVSLGTGQQPFRPDFQALLAQGQLADQLIQHDQQQQQQLELELELLERQQMRQQQQDQLQQELESIQQQFKQLQQPKLSYPAPGARTINDLVPQGDEDLDDPLRRLKERGSTPKHYCGRNLMDVLELVCEGRFYNGEIAGPTIVDPTVKSKRDIRAPSLLIEANNHHSANGPIAKRTLAQEGAMSAGGSGLGRGRKRSNIFNEIPGANQGKNNDQNHSNNNGDNIMRSNDNNNSDNNSATNKSNINDNVNSNNDNNNNNNDNDNISANSNDNNNKNINNGDKLKQQKRDTYANLMNQNRNNKHSKMSRYRMIRGAVEECCVNSCYLDDMKSYCMKAAV